MNLTEVLHEASDAPPPARIDLDGIIRKRQTRVRGAQMLATGFVAVAVLAVISLFVTNAKPTGGVAAPATGDSRTTAELSGELKSLVLNELPGGWSMATTPRFRWDGRNYTASFEVANSHGARSRLTITISTVPAARAQTCAPDHPPTVTCDTHQISDGSHMAMIWKMAQPGTTPAIVGIEMIWNNHSPTIATEVAITEKAVGSAQGVSDLALTADQLMSISTAPGLHIKP